jgi:hypothetical protein
MGARCKNLYCHSQLMVIYISISFKIRFSKEFIGNFWVFEEQWFLLFCEKCQYVKVYIFQKQMIHIFATKTFEP